MRVFPNRTPADARSRARGIGGSSEPDVLELRIDGGSSTPAAEMLGPPHQEICGAEAVSRAGHLCTLVTHGGFPRALVGHEALDEVLGRMTRPTR